MWWVITASSEGGYIPHTVRISPFSPLTRMQFMAVNCFCKQLICPHLYVSHVPCWHFINMCLITLPWQVFLTWLSYREVEGMLVKSVFAGCDTVKILLRTPLLAISRCVCHDCSRYFKPETWLSANLNLTRAWAQHRHDIKLKIVPFEKKRHTLHHKDR